VILADMPNYGKSDDLIGSDPDLNARVTVELMESGEGMAVTMDVTGDAQMDAAYASVAERFGTTDVLVNCAALVSETLFAPLGRVRRKERCRDAARRDRFQHTGDAPLINCQGIVQPIAGLLALFVPIDDVPTRRERAHRSLHADQD